MLEVTVVMETHETRERERQQILRDRVRDSIRYGNPRVFQPIEDSIEDMTCRE